MSSKESPQFGVLIKNELLKDCTKQQLKRTAIMGRIVMVMGCMAQGNVLVKFLDDDLSWEPQKFFCPQESITYINDKFWDYFAAITSPQERVKLAKNRKLCEKLKLLSVGCAVAFNDSTKVFLGVIRYMGNVTGIGKCYGIDLYEEKEGNKCCGDYKGIPYFQCTKGHGVFTTIDKIRPLSYYPNTERNSPPATSELDLSLQRNITSIMNEHKPKNEDIVTKYNEYPVKTAQIKSASYHRNSLSLQNIVDIDSTSTNPNNDFDQNTMIQPEKSHLITSDLPKKSKVKSEVDLIDVIGGSWSGSTDIKELENFSNLKLSLDRNDNIRTKHSHTDGTMTLRSTRNKSANVLTHLLDESSTTGRKSKFYTDVGLSLKEDYSRKINEKNEQLAAAAAAAAAASRTSTFYVNDKPKYSTPAPGTTNDLGIESLVQVVNHPSEKPLYGVIRWMGLDASCDVIVVGVELEDEHVHLTLPMTDGIHNGERFFACPEGRAIFVPLEQCQKDSRFLDGTPTPIPSGSESKCELIQGAVPPLLMPTEQDVEAVCGQFRGIQGHHNSCYLDVTLFSMFTYTGAFDGVLFRPKNANDIPDYEEVQRVLREEIVNPLRTNLYVSADHVMKLRKLLDRLSSVSGLTSEEKDPEEFLNSLLAQILKAEPFLKLNSGQEAFHYQLFVEKNAELTLPTVQQLFEQSFFTSNVKLKEVPSCLIIQMPRFGKSYKMYPRILPSQLLDVTDIIEGSPRVCNVCGKLARWECRECFDSCVTGSLENTAFCQDCLAVAHRNEKRQHHKTSRLEVAQDFEMMEDHCQLPRLFMELFAVICIETSHYVAFVKCGVGHEAPWCFFDSMADRRGEKNGFNIPELVACPDVSRWLSDESICRQLHEKYPLDRLLPEHARRLLCDAYICMYQSSDVMMYR